MTEKALKILRIILICAVILGIAFLLIRFVPWPTRIDQQMTGAELSGDGEVLQECTLNVQGWKLDFLFQKDQIKMELFNVENLSYFNLPSQRFTDLHDNISEEYQHTSWLWHDSHNSQAVMAFIANDNSWILFRTDNRYFAVSLDGRLSPEEIWKTVTADVNFK